MLGRGYIVLRSMRNVSRASRGTSLDLVVFATPIALLMYVDFTHSNAARFLSLRCVHITSIPYVRIGMEEVYSGVKPDWSLVWVPSPRSSRQRYLP